MPILNISTANWLCKKLISINRKLKIAFMLVADLIALPCCFFIAMLLRLGDIAFVIQYNILSYFLLTILTVIAFFISDLYRAVIRFIDQRLLIKTGMTLAVTVLFVYFAFFAFDYQHLPRSALMIYWFIAFSYVVVSRLAVQKLLRSYTKTQEKVPDIVAIYGAGEAGAQLALAMRTSNEYHPVCFFDEKHILNQRTIIGLSVFHSDCLVDIVKLMGVKSIVIAIPSASPQRLQKITHMMCKAGVAIKISHRLLALADDEDLQPSVREIKIEDLLGRDPVPPRHDLFAKCVQGKSVLVTGAGGSIGSELCRQIMSLAPRTLHLLDHSEFALYTIKQELLTRFPGLPIRAHLGSVCSSALIERVMQEDDIDTIYHAAAYKHVPLVEANIVEGIRNNVLGTQILAAAAKKFHVETCVLISSDKAVRPTNIMGASKRIAELIFQAAASSTDSRTTFCMVRFGNVLGSSGSVVPLFQRQIEQGGPLTITHPDVVRYFMLIPEAAQLVMQAGAMASGGDVFVLDMGKPIKIIDLARTMLVLAGLSEKTADNPLGDIAIKIVGLFPGEKLYEELLISNQAFASEHPRIMCVKENALRPDVLNHYINLLIAACHTNQRATIESMVKVIVAEYTPAINHESAPEIIELQTRSPQPIPAATWLQA